MTETQDWDVFVSHSHLDEAAAAWIQTILTESGLKVFRAAGAVDTFALISPVVMDALRHSKILLACYSAAYPTRTACQHEFATAYLAGQAEGDPFRRVVAVNLERGLGHIEPRQLRDMLLPSVLSPAAVGGLLVEAVQARLSSAEGLIGDVEQLRPTWLSFRPVYPPSSYVGRWSELWWLHSALHPQVAPLTSPTGPPIAVVYGPGGIGKTALAAEYIRRFGSTFAGGINWMSTDAEPLFAGADALHVIDDALGDMDQVARWLPAISGTPTLILTKDAGLSKLGNSLPLNDLNNADSALLIATCGATQADQDPVLLAEITAATAGSPEVRAQVASLAASVGAEAALDQLHDASSELLRPVLRWLSPELRALDETGWDILRILASAAPAPLPILRIADILAATGDSQRLQEIVSVQKGVMRLLERGILSAPADAVELSFVSAFVLAVRRLERNPRRAEQLRATTLRMMARQAGSGEGGFVPRGAGIHREDEVRAAHRIQTELIHRITGHPLGDDEGSLRDALTSLHSLVQIIRAAQGSVHPAASRGWQRPANSLEDIADRLINVVLRQPLTHWHIELSAYEDLRPAGISRMDHERRWKRNAELRETLVDVHRQALAASDELGQITGNSYIVRA